MQSAARGDRAGISAVPETASNDAASWVALLEKVLRKAQNTNLQQEIEVRTRLLHLYLDELRDPASAAVHAEALLDENRADKAVVDAASALVEYRPIAARIGEKLSAAYARLGEIQSEIGMLSKELSLARPPRLDLVKRRLAELRFSHRNDVDGALELLEPLLLRSPGDDALRTRYVEMTAASGRRARAVATLRRISQTEKNGAARDRILTDLGVLHLQDGDRESARDVFLEAMKGADGSRAVLSAIERISDPEDKKHILKVLATACSEDLDHLPRAVELWHRLLRDDPKNLDALMDLLSGYERLGNAEALFAEIEHALFLFEGEQYFALMLRKASALMKFDEREQSSELLAKLLAQPDLPTSCIESILAVAYEDDQFDIYVKALELLARAEDPTLRRRALERLGDFHFEQRGDAPAAVESWKPAARLYMEESSEDTHGRELFERVLEVSPNDDESALELVALYAKSGEWGHVPECYAALLRSGAGIEVAIATLLDVEEAAARAGAVDEYISMIDETIPLLSVRDDDSHYRLIRAKVRMLSADARREAEASAAYRQVLELFARSDDIEAYATFIESRGSAGERLADLRWLFEFRVNRAAAPLPVLREWARVEEEYDDLEGAVRVHQRIVERAPADLEALETIARLKRALGDLEGCLGALRTLRNAAEPSHAAALDIRIATLLVDELGRPVDGVLVLEPWLRGPRVSREPIEIVRRSLAPAESRPEVLEAVLRAIGNEGPAEAADLFEVLVDAAGSDLGRVPGARWAMDRATLILSARARWDELLRLYEHAIETAPSDGERTKLLNEAAIAARDLAREPERAIRFFEGLLELHPSDVSVQGALERLYERQGKTHELARLLSARVELATGGARLELLHRLAAAQIDLGHLDPAAETLEKMLESGASVDDVKSILERMLDASGGESPAAPEAPAVAERAGSLLAAHYKACGQTHDLIRVTKTLLLLSNDPAVRARRIRDLVRARLTAADDADAAFSIAHAALKDDLAGDAQLSEAAGHALLDEASREWERRGAGPDSDPARTARATILELAAHHDLHARPKRALSVLEAGLELPFTLAEKRELRAKIASLLADRLNELERATGVFDELFAEEAGDSVAESCAGRFAELLASQGRTREQAELWGRIGHSSGLSGQHVRAAEAWSRAANHWEDLGDPDHAITAHSAAAAHGSEVAIAALARLHAAGSRWLDSAQALEWLVPQLTGARGIECRLTLADAYVKAGELELARCRLVELVHDEPEVWSPRARLIELYRDGAAWNQLAELLVDTARLASEPGQRLELLREAIGVRLRLLRDPEGAASVAAAALRVDPQSTATRLELGEALDAAGRHDESVRALREGLSGGGDGRSKQDAALRRAIAVALLHAGRRKEALAELEAAVRLNPTEPGTLHALGRVAFDEGNLDLAEATMRGLLLALHHGTMAGSEGPSRAEVYLDLSRIAELRGDRARARDLTESAFDSALESPEDTIRLQRALENEGRHELLALVLERRLRGAGDAATTVQALDALVTLWEGPLDRVADTAAVIARYAEVVAREAEGRRDISTDAWAAHVRACAAVGGEASRAEAVKRRIALLERVAKSVDGDEATSILLETARQYELGLGQTERAATIAEALFEKDPTREDVWLLLRDLYGRMSSPDRILDLAEAVLWSTRSSLVHKQVRLDLARALLEDPAKVDLAITTLKGILEDEPSDVAARDALVDALERDGRHEELIVILAAGLDFLDPGRRRVASMRLGRALERASRMDEAATVYVRLAADGQASVEELRVVATRLHALGSEHLADCLEQLLGRETGVSAVEVARRLVDLRAAKQDRPGLLRALSMGFALRPEDPRFRDRLLRTYEEDGRWGEVVLLLERAVAAEPSNRALVQRLVEAHQRAADVDRALEVLDRGLLRHPSDADLLRQRAWLHEANGRLDDAIIDLEKAYAVDPSLADDLITVLAQATPGEGGRRSIQLVDLLLSLDRAPDARSVVEELVARMPGHVGGLERLASLAAADGESDLALQLYHELLPRLKDDPPALVRVVLAIAALCDSEGNLGDATDALERAYELVPTNDELRDRLAQAYEATGAAECLADLLEAGARRTAVPSETASLLLRAAECVLDAAPHRALELSEASRATDPRRVDGIVMCARCLARLGRLDQAETTLGELPKMPRGQDAELVSSIHLELARLYLSTDDLVEAFDCLKRAFTVNSKNDEASLLLGLVAIDLDDPVTALRALRMASSSRSALAPESRAMALQQLARLTSAQGKARPDTGP